MNEKKIAIMGLGYVGLPLAVNLSPHFKIKGFDISDKRIANLKKGIDETLEVKNTKLRDLNLTLRSEIAKRRFQKMRISLKHLGKPE